MMPCCSGCQGIGKRVRGGSEGAPCLGRSSHRHKASLSLREFTALLCLWGRGRLLLLGGFISMLMRLKRWAQLFSSKNSISPFLALWAYLSDLDTLCLIKAVFVFSSFYSFYFMPNPFPLPLLEQTVSSGCPLPRSPRGNLWRQARWGFSFCALPWGWRESFTSGTYGSTKWKVRVQWWVR